jgi:hypothetical protein
VNLKIIEDSQPMFFAACHSVVLLIFAVALVFAGMTVVGLRNAAATYNARLFTFGYFSFGAWLLWVLQYALLAAPFLSFPSSFSLDTILALALIQNALWACAVLSLYFKQFSRKSLTLPALGIFSFLFWLGAYKTKLLTSEQFTQFVGPIDGISTATIFIVLGISIVQLRLSKIFSAFFFIHGLSQWIWTWRWLTSFGTTPAVQLGFPLWRIALLIVWMRLLSKMAERAQSSDQKLAHASDQKSDSGFQQPKLPKLLTPLKVMISSTVEDLRPERDAVDRAIRGLNLTRFRAETFGSVPHPPKVICALLAEQCDIFLLIIGERSGYMIESEGISVVEFEFRVARAQNREKILVYVKDGVDREPILEEFLKRVEHFEHGYFRSLFTTPDDLHQKVQGDVARLLAYK